MDLKTRLLEAINTCPLALREIAKEININYVTLHHFLYKENKNISRLCKIKVEEWIKKNSKKA